MAIGDGIRRNVATVSLEERRRLIHAFLALDRTKFYGDNVSYWDKQNEIHRFHAAGAHNGPAFLTWHRELCNRLEASIREVDPDLSLHYWDWTTDPRASPDGRGGTVNLFDNHFMDRAAGPTTFPLHEFRTTTEPRISRSVRAGAPDIAADLEIVSTGDGSAQADQYRQMELKLEFEHDKVHQYIGGTIENSHTAFHDPFVFMIHSNVDRLFATWQMRAPYRLDPVQVYGNQGNHADLTNDLQPWAGGISPLTGTALRPWAPPENELVHKNSKDPSVVAPPAYDSFTTHQDNWRICQRCSCIVWTGFAGRCQATGGAHLTQGSLNLVLVADTVPPFGPSVAGQDNWRWCNKCSALAYAGNGPTRCPSGGSHNTTGHNYRVALSQYEGPEQHGWRWCSKCGGLFYYPNGGGACSAGGSHNGSSSGIYSLSHAAPAAYGQEGWRHCRKCQGLAYAGNGPGACPQGGSHDHSQSGAYKLTHAPMPAPGQNLWRICIKCYVLHYGGNSPGPCPVGGTHDSTGSGDYILPHAVQQMHDLEGGGWCSKCQTMVVGSPNLGACPGGGNHDVSLSGLYRFNTR